MAVVSLACCTDQGKMSMHERLHIVAARKRYQLYVLMKTAQSPIQIATVVGVYKSTISRERRWNWDLCGYRHHQAHRFAQARQRCKQRRRFPSTVWQQRENLVRQVWSPITAPSPMVAAEPITTCNGIQTALLILIWPRDAMPCTMP